MSTVTTPRARVDPRVSDLGRTRAPVSRRVVWAGRVGIVLFTVLLVLGLLEVTLRLFGRP